MTILDRFKTLLGKYGLGDEFVQQLHSTQAIVWGSAAIHCCLEKPSWEPADLDILVGSSEEAAKLSSSLASAGYESGIKTTVRDVGLIGYEDNVRAAFAESIDSVIIHQQWRWGVVQLICGLPPMEIHGRIRRVIKIYVGSLEDALAAADLDICQSRIEFGGGSITALDMTDGIAANLIPSLFDLSTDDMRRLDKYRGRGFLIKGDN